MTITFKTNINFGKSILASCPKCKNKTNHIICANYIRHYSDSSIDELADYQIIQCQGCDTISFREEHQNSEDFYVIETRNGLEEKEYEVTEILYPPRLKNEILLNETELNELPDQIKNIYTEVSKAFVSGLNILFAVGLRSLIEAIFHNQSLENDYNNLKISNLNKKIDFLAKKREFSRKTEDMLHHIRQIGNTAAHEIAIQDTRQLELALEALGVLIKELYIFPLKKEKYLSNKGVH